MKKDILKDLQEFNIKAKDLQIFHDYFSIIHHTKGRIRLRANPKLKQYAENSAIDFHEFLEFLEQTPFILEVKLNKLIGSLTIHYDFNLVNPKVFENLIKGEKLEEIAEMINVNLKDFHV